MFPKGSWKILPSFALFRLGDYQIKRLHKLKKKVAYKGGIKQILTPSEQEVLHLLTKEFLTPKKVAIRRGCSHQNVYKIIKRLRKKGVINQFFEEVAKTQGTMQPLKGMQPLKCNHQIRLHSQEFNIKILFKDQRYKRLLEKANTITIDGNTIRLYRNSIEIYSGQSFYADTAQKATVKSFEYWNRLFARLENDLKLILIKPRAQNIKLVNQHYAEINNELAEECEKKADKIRVYTTDDGKLWFLIDNSFNLHEAETQGKTSKQDMDDTVQPFFNDLRDKTPPVLSEVWGIVAANSKHQEIFGNSLEVYNKSTETNRVAIETFTKQIQMHLNVLQNMDSTMSAIKEALSPLKEHYPKPDKIIDYLFENPLELAKFKLMSKQKQNKILFGREVPDEEL